MNATIDSTIGFGGCQCTGKMAAKVIVALPTQSSQTAGIGAQKRATSNPTLFFLSQQSIKSVCRDSANHHKERYIVLIDNKWLNG
jgi:hypothetical protein